MDGWVFFRHEVGGEISEMRVMLFILLQALSSLHPRPGLKAINHCYYYRQQNLAASRMFSTTYTTRKMQ
jgi:hypothetical protein